MRSLAFALGIGAVCASAFYAARTRYGRQGSTTNASEAVDDIEIKPDATADDVLDAGLQETFPASDPIAIGKAYQRKVKKGA